MIEMLRNCEKYMSLKRVFHEMTGGTLHLDSMTHDDPTPCSTMNFCNCMMSNPELAKSCKAAHQKIRNESKSHVMHISPCPSGLLHLLVPIHHNGSTIGFIRCSGLKHANSDYTDLEKLNETINKNPPPVALVNLLELQFDKTESFDDNQISLIMMWLLHQACSFNDLMNLWEDINIKPKCHC